MSKFIGLVSAYAYAKSKGYTGTEEEFAILMAEYASVTETAVEAVRIATESAQSAAAASSDVNRAAATVTQQAAQVHNDAETSSESAATASEAKETAVDKALDSEAYALGTRDGEDVGSSDPAYHNNAKYYAESAGINSTTATEAAQTATQKASEAQASASAAAESARTLTIDKTLTKAGQAADSKAVGDKFPVVPIKTTFFDNLNYGVPENVKFTHEWVDPNGVVSTATDSTNSLIVDIKPNTTYWFFAPSMNRSITIESNTGQFDVGSSYTKLHGSNKTTPFSFTTGSSAKKIMVYFYSGTYDYDANKNNIVITKDNYVLNIQPKIKNEYLNVETPTITPINTTFFEGLNYFDSETASIYTDRFIYTDGQIKPESYSGVNTLVIPVKPNTSYYLHIPDNNRGIIVENANDQFVLGLTYNVLYAGGMSATYYRFTTSANCNYIAVYFYSGTYDYDANKNSIVLNKDTYYGKDAIPFIPYEHLPSDLNSPVSGANILIFGDSITTCCNITIDANHQTSAYVWRNPSNSYVDGEGNTVRYSMWPKILKESEPCGEIRNYAESGASYKTSTRGSGNERQNLHYQIDVAMNDLDNPNGVFEVDDYVPDIVIFALGTNDGAPNDTYESAMAKTVLKSDNATVDVDATLLALDETKFCESARKAFLRVKQAFPMAQIYCSLPIQRANNEVNFNNTHDVLKKIAERCGCVVIDGTSNSGIVREFNDWNSLGTYLKDGLHPNEKGQNLLARTIIKAIKAHYMPFGRGFN